MEITVRHESGATSFEFSVPARFDIFVISNAEEQVFWELLPSYMLPSPIVGPETLHIGVPPEVGRALYRAKYGFPSEPPADVPLVSHVVYGHVPTGYREAASAVPLQSGVTYALLVWSDVYGWGMVHFVP